MFRVGILLNSRIDNFSVETGGGEMCHADKQPPTIPLKSRGYLSSVVTDETGVGNPHCPWQLSVPRGQRINLTLHNFFDSWGATDNAGGSEPLREGVVGAEALIPLVACLEVVDQFC